MSTALVVSLNQAAIDGIRAAGAKQVINVEGNGRWRIFTVTEPPDEDTMLYEYLGAPANSSQPGQAPGPGQPPKALTARPTRELLQSASMNRLTDRTTVT